MYKPLSNSKSFFENKNAPKRSVFFYQFIFLNFILAYFSKNSLKKNSQLVLNSSRNQLKTVQDTLGLFNTIILENKYEYFMNRYKNFDRSLRISQASNQLIRLYPRYLLEGLALFVLAIVFKIILNKLETLKPSLMESAYDLGASKWQAFYYVLLPNIKLSLIIAGLLAFTISLDETLITLFLIGNDTTWPIKLWAKMRVGFSKQVNASVTLILILTSLLVLLIASIISRSEKKIMY